MTVLSNFILQRKNESPEFKDILEKEEKEIQSNNKKSKEHKIIIKNDNKSEIIEIKKKTH